MFPRIKKVKALPNHRCQIEWADGTSDIIDLTYLTKQNNFRPLQNEVVFRNMEIINWGHGIAWPDHKLDYNSESLYLRAHPETKNDQ